MALGVCAVLATGQRAAEATPLQFGANFYDLVIVSDPFTDANNSWWTAQANAQASLFMGVAGHLATVTSEAENDFLVSLATPLGLTGFEAGWLGGSAVGQWLVGPDAGQNLTYVNWGGAEPNNAGFFYMMIATPPSYIGLGEWADDSFTQGFPDGADQVVGYFVEYETAVPEPSTAVLLAIGAFGLAFARRWSLRRPHRR
jgi:hypothetical protein